MSSRQSYRNAGVNIDTANKWIRTIKPFVQSTESPNVLSAIGHYAGLFALDREKYKDPVLVASTDGVGTKLKLALDAGDLSGLGQDLVAMSANDILCLGARPLFFLDYFATGKLEPEKASILIKGITHACQSIDCPLLGGETAEMPGLYRRGDFDLAGFIVGVVERDRIVDGRGIRAGDRIIGVASSGPHSNGFSLIRKIIAGKRLSLKKIYPPLDRPLGEVLLEPTPLYVKPVFDLIERFELHGIAHITGGGLLENLPRILPDGCHAILKKGSWPIPPVFQLLQQWGRIADQEMHRVFNCGIGLMLVVRKDQQEAIRKRLQENNEQAWVIGEIVNSSAVSAPLDIFLPSSG